MRALALLLLTACGTLDPAFDGYYRACMRRLDADDTDREAHAVCRKRAKSDVWKENNPAPDSTTICRRQFGALVCETYD